MGISGNSLVVEDPSRSTSGTERARYLAAYAGFSRGLTPAQRSKINGTAKPDWQGNCTFSLPVKPDSPAYRSEQGDPVLETLEEIAGLNGALPKIALWLQDRMGGTAAEGSAVPAAGADVFRMAIARICESKNPRLEAHLVGLAIGLSLHGNSNGYVIARHFGLKPQVIHESLASLCSELGLPKPLSKSNTKGYAKTQYRHHVRAKAA